MPAVITAEGGRWLRALTYLVIMSGGAWSLLWPSQNLVSYGTGLVTIGYALAMLGGGAACLYGATRGRWDGELVGLPLVVPASGGLTLVLVATIGDSLGRGTIAAVALTCTLLLADRWRGVARVARMAREDARRDPRPT
ncbi:hypothetical protein ACFW4K_26885 [Nocardiopsis alba]|uniref:hypothetical protein n=1 Tax=Nocardiopsis alba TaxID=53437 RepID=UPI00366F4729